LLFLVAFVGVPTLGQSQGWERSSFEDTVKFIDGKLSQVEKNKQVGYRFTAPTICVAHWGNESIRAELAFSTIGRIGVDTGTDASVLCTPEGSRCISVQYHAESAWIVFDQVTYARFSVGNESDSAQVQLALSHLIAMCGSGS
jgi:hypothetical protein